jgi:hypothetical protein
MHVAALFRLGWRVQMKAAGCRLIKHLSEPLNLTWDVVKLSQDGVSGTYPPLDKRKCRRVGVLFRGGGKDARPG